MRYSGNRGGGLFVRLPIIIYFFCMFVKMKGLNQ